uniref:Uncharacterized protein n=1 Tax=Arundo donax TaxID=35708 RepID=A0A0A8XSQ9_ARUDO
MGKGGVDQYSGFTAQIPLRLMIGVLKLSFQI